jgi:hypothetical protein
MSAQNYRGNGSLAINLIRIFLTLVISVGAVIAGGIVASFCGLVVLGFHAYDASFSRWPWGWAAILSVVFYLGCGVVVGIVTWWKSAGWAKLFVAHQHCNEPYVYSEIGGTRFSWRGLIPVNVTWPFARILVSKEQLEIRTMGFRFLFERDEGVRLHRQRGMRSSGVAITSSDGKTYVYWSWNANGLIERLRDFGWGVEE